MYQHVNCIIERIRSRCVAIRYVAFTDLHQDEEGREEQQGRPLDPGEHGLHVVPVGEQEQQERTQQRRPAQAQSAWKKKQYGAWLDP